MERWENFWFKSQPTNETEIYVRYPEIFGVYKDRTRQSQVLTSYVWKGKIYEICSPANKERRQYIPNADRIKRIDGFIHKSKPRERINERVEESILHTAIFYGKIIHENQFPVIKIGEDIMSESDTNDTDILDEIILHVMSYFEAAYRKYAAKFKKKSPALSRRWLWYEESGK